MTPNLDETSHARDSIITGEGVALEMPAASFASRVTSGFIDYVLYAFIAFGAWELLFDNLNQLNTAQFQTMTRIIMAATFFMVPAVVSYITHGSSLGKKIVGLRVVRHDGGTPTGRQHFIRAAVGVVDVWLSFGVIATLTSMASSRGSRFGDMVAGTYVVVWPRSKSWDRKLELSPYLSEWYSNALVRPIPTALHLNITEFLGSRKKMTTQAREDRARELAASVEHYCSIPAPRDTPAEEFLVGVILSRHETDERRFAKTRTRHERALHNTGSLPYWS